MVKHTQTIPQLLRTDCLSVFDHFVGLALKWLSIIIVPQGNVIFKTLNLYLI